MMNVILRQHAVDRFKQRTGIYENVEETIRFMLISGRIATSDEIHLIRYSRRRLAKGIKGKTGFDRSDIIIISEDFAFIINNNELVTCFECKYLKILQNGTYGANSAHHTVGPTIKYKYDNSWGNYKSNKVQYRPQSDSPIRSVNAPKIPTVNLPLHECVKNSTILELVDWQNSGNAIYICKLVKKIYIRPFSNPVAVVYEKKRHKERFLSQVLASQIDLP